MPGKFYPPLPPAISARQYCTLVLLQAKQGLVGLGCQLPIQRSNQLAPAQGFQPLHHPQRLHQQARG